VVFVYHAGERNIVFVMLTKEASARRSDDFFVSMTSE